MHYCIHFLFTDAAVNNEIDMSIWRFLPASIKKHATFFKSGGTWFETTTHHDLPQLELEFTNAIDAVFAHYKDQDMFGYLEPGNQEYLDRHTRPVFRLAPIDPQPPQHIVDKINTLKHEILQAEDNLYSMKKEYTDLIRQIDAA